MFNDYSPKHNKLKGDLTAAREQLFATLDQYAELCLNIRNTHHQASFKQSTGFPWSELVSELPFLPLLGARLQEATQNLNRAYELGQARASLAYPPHIDKLPDEILTQIFRLAQPRDLHPIGKYGTTSFPSYPDSISQTCVRWRKVALACSPLWTYIYLASHPTHFDSILDHAKSYALRAGHLPVELCITGLEGRTDPNLGSTYDDLKQFLASIAHRTKSLEIFRSNSVISRVENEGLAGILRGCSEVFTSLVVHSKGLPHPLFIRPLDENGGGWGPGDIGVDLSLEQIECGLAHLAVLHLSQLYPRWTSTAYQGLVDLRLVSKHKFIYECPRIEPSEFIAILSASPRLRILHFGLNLESDRDSPTNNTSVRLNDLEVLYLAASRCYGPEDTEYEIQRIMRHITPGSKPLRLTLDLAGYHEQEPIETMKAFFSRSHIVKFCAKGGNPPPMQLLDCAPNLTNLVFDRCRYDALYDFRQARSQVIKLDSWIVRGSPIYIEDLEQLLKQYSARSIIMSNCRLFSKEDGPVEIPESDLGEWGFQLPDNVQYLNPDFSSDPTADWNNLE